MTRQALTGREVLRTWWPLAASWLMMGLEMPAIGAVMARLPGAEISLAAYAGIVYPIALVVEAPIILLLAASTALCGDPDSYRKVRRFMMAAGASLTALHLLLAFTPLFDVVAGDVLGAPPQLLEPGRLGVRLMTPWTWAIAYRRFQQGVLIRFGRSSLVGTGTVVRLVTNAAILAFGAVVGNWPGIVVGTAAMAGGVVVEAVFAGGCVRPVLRDRLARGEPPAEPLHRRAFLRFYVPLALTSLFTFLAWPLASSAMARMPDPVDSLAAWPILSGLVFILRSLGLPLNEVAVALLGRPGAVRELRRFTIAVSSGVTVVVLALVATPLADVWFVGVSALAPHLAEVARTGLWLSVPLPALIVWQHWYQGVVVHGRHTRGVTESVVAYLAVGLSLLGVAIALGRWNGLYVVSVGATAASAVQVAWLRFRAAPVLRGELAADGQAIPGDALTGPVPGP
jgi:hypothetical protein